MKVPRGLVLVAAFLYTSILMTPCTGVAQGSGPVSITEVRPIQTTSGDSFFQVTYTLHVPQEAVVYMRRRYRVCRVERNSLVASTRNSHLVIRVQPKSPALSDTLLTPSAISMSGSLTLVPHSDFKYPGGQSAAIVSNKFRTGQAQLLATYFLIPPYIYSYNALTISESLS